MSESSTDQYCPSCGNCVEAGDTFCRSCGCELDEADREGETTAKSDERPPPDDLDPEQLYQYYPDEYDEIVADPDAPEEVRALARAVRSLAEESGDA